MAIQPIDLQTLYTQMDKVSKNVVQQQQQTQLHGSMEIAGLVKKDIQKSTTVERTEKKDEMSSIKNKKNSNDNNENKSKKKKEEETQEEVVVEFIKDPALGKNLDVSVWDFMGLVIFCVFILVVNIVMWIFCFKLFRKSFSAKGVLNDMKQEASKIMVSYQRRI